MTELQQLQQELVRERHERQKAEVTLVTRSLELLQANEKLTEINNDLEVLVEKRTQQFNLLIDKSPMGMLTLDSSFQIIRINEKIQSIFEVSEEELIGLNFTEWAFTIEVDPDLIDHQAIGGERFVKLASGKRIYFETHFNQIQYDGVDYFLVVIQLINKRKEIIKKYEERDREYTELLENISDVIYKLNSDGYYTYINQNVLSLTGYTHEEFIGTHFTDIIEEPYRTSTVEFYVNQREKKIPSTYLELPIRAKNGDEVWVGQTVTIQHKKNGEVEFLSVCRDITSRKRMENAILRSEEKYRSIIENLELGLLEVDPNGIVIYAYPKFCELSGYEPHELIGQNAADILLSESAQRMMEEQMSKRIEGQSSVYEVELTRKDGEVRWVIISGAPYYNENNEIAGTVGIHLDITNRKLIEQELLQAKELAEASSKSKDLFMANMSHEIRTPLNAIVGMGSLLEETDLDDRQQRYLNAISSSSENLLAIVNDLLDFSKIGSGKMKLELVPSDLRNQLHVLMDIWEVRAESKGLYFEQYIDPAIQAAYLYDPTKLNGVLTNLLQNALKFTEKGGFSLSVIKKSNHQQKDILRFEVFDTGIGVAKEKQSDIFESFVQAENSTTRKYGGTGLGLAISKSMVEQMGGTLELDSELNKGSTFSFEIALEATSIVESSKENKPLLDDLHGLKVLLVEDNSINRVMAQTIMENWKIEVSSAENGLEALSILSERQFDLILMDMQMPVLDGIQTTEIIRKERQLSIPIIALTANAISGEETKCFEAGMNGFISKPFKQHDLYQALYQMKMSLSAEHDLFHAKKTTPVSLPEETPMQTESLIDLTLLKQNTNGDLDFMTKMMELVISETEKRMIEIKTYLSLADYNSIQKIIHAMKPSIDHVAISCICELLRSIETHDLQVREDFEAKVANFSQLIEILIAELKKVDLSKI